MHFPAFNFNNGSLDFDKPRIMGILNVTPDSFSDGGRYYSVDAAVDRALQMLDEGSDIIDIGGESTRPGSDPVPAEEELKRIIPVLKKIMSISKSALVSIDTTKSDVAREALYNGAAIINDISGLTFDGNMIPVVRSFDSAIVIMHIKGNPKTMQQNPYYDDVLTEVMEFLESQSRKASENGVSKIIIDPGIGFGKRIEDNFGLIKNLEVFASLKYPLMIGLSRKSFIGRTLDIETDDRDIPTVILETAAVLKSARIIRTHNVKYCSQMVKLVKHII